MALMMLQAKILQMTALLAPP